MRRRLFRLAAGLSAVLCIAVCVLWARSYKFPDRFGTRRGVDRYTVVSAGGRLTLFGPPPAAAEPAARRAAAEAVGALRNDQIYWDAYANERVLAGTSLCVYWPGPLVGSPAERCEWAVQPGDRVRPLLSALEDPDRFAVAHLLLRRQIPWNVGVYRVVPSAADPRIRDVVFVQRDDGAAVSPGVDYDGLRIPLRLDPGGHRVVVRTEHYGLTAAYDPAPIPAIRDQWHRRLDAPIGRFPHAPLVAATAAVPLFMIASGARRWRTRRRRLTGNLCRDCGYDLRASPVRCPECGAVPGAKKVQA